MSWLRRLWHRNRLEQELDKELRFHLERQIQDLIAQGTPPDEAKRRACLIFGGPEQIKEACRDQRGTRWLQDFLRDCQYGIRLLWRSPAFTCAAVLSLALGISANTAIFSLMDLVMLNMMPVREPERLVQFTRYRPDYGRSAISYPLFAEFERDLKSFDGLLAQSPLGRREVFISRQPEDAEIELVSGSYYSVLGVSAVAGRVFSSEGDHFPGTGPVAVISYRLWTRRFGLDPNAIGKVFRLNDTLFTIIGVTPPEFFGVTVGQAPEITIPLAMDAEARGSVSWLEEPNNNWLSVMGRLRNGSTIREAQAEVNTIFAGLVAADAERQENKYRKNAVLGQRMELEPSGNGFDRLRYRFSEPLRVFMGIVALVLLIACANLANLLLARSAARQREISVRLAIGAGRWRIVRQLLTEGFLLSILGGALGAVVAVWFANGLVVMMSNGGPRIPLEIRLDARVLAFVAVASIVSCLLFSLAPAIQATRQRLQPALAEARAGRWRLGKGLIVAQMAISVLLLVATGLFGRTLLNMYSVDTGFNERGVYLFSLNTFNAGYRGANLRDLQAHILRELPRLRGVISASLALLPPISDGAWDASLFVDGYAHAPDEDDKSHLNAVGPWFFKTLGTPVLLGREFNERDDAAAPKVAVVNETFARYYFKGRSPLGRWLSMGGPNRDRVEIVGVVKNVKYRDLRQSFPRTAYFAAAQSLNAPDWHTYVVRTSLPPAESMRLIEAGIRSIYKDLRTQDMRSLEEHVSRSILQERMLATLSGFFGALALGLAAIGIYGVMAFQVARRRREIGIRVVLGARPREIVGMVVGQTGRLVMAGGAIGVAIALALTRGIQKMLFGLKPADPSTLVMAVGCLALVALAASFLPGQKASRLNPVETLKCD